MSEQHGNQPSAAKNNAANELSAEIKTRYTTLIEQALHLQADNDNKIDKARQLILSGQLDTPENIRKTAEHIATFGV